MNEKELTIWYKEHVSRKLKELLDMVDAAFSIDDLESIVGIMQRDVEYIEDSIPMLKNYLVVKKSIEEGQH